MTSESLLKLIDRVVSARSEYQHIELKAARKGCPERFYDTLSSFSNLDDGGTFTRLQNCVEILTVLTI